MKHKVTIETLKIQYTAFFHYVRNGVRKITSKPWKYPYPILHILLAVFIINKIPKASDSDIWIVSVLKTTILILAIMVAVFTFIYIIVRIGKPFKTKNVHINLYKIGLVNRFGDIPTLVDKYKLKNSKNVFVYKFLNNGISLIEFDKKKEHIESSLNKNVIKMKYGKNKKEILMYAYSGNQVEFKTIPWEDKYLINDDFVIALGESSLEQVTINLSSVPHILLGGASGSGKSILLKVILMQCIKKNAEIYLADFKGGIDFPRVWHENCDIILDEGQLLITLNSITDVLEIRKKKFRENEVSKLSEYNALGNDMKHIIFACDEIAEVLDKTGVSKEQKEIIMQIESCLSIIARQGRALGIHLILATQRPDANIFNGQIKSNISYRICGRADSVLSSIILDSTEASNVIPNDSQGLFLNQDNVLFQAYWFNDKQFKAWDRD